MASIPNLRRLLSPSSIVFVGGRNLVEPIGHCRAIGFRGEIYVVNPQHAEIAGIRCHASVAELPVVPDAAFVAVRSEATPAVVRELAARGCGGAVCYAAGFAEVGGAGVARQRELVEAAGAMALVGPNCYGVLNYVDGAALWPDRHGGRPVTAGAALISQSGNISLNLTMARRSAPLAYVISVGNQAQLGVEDYLDVLAEDPRVTAIGLYVEGLRDVARFSRAAARALAAGKPVIALKAGRSALAAELTLSHTSSLAGADALYDALFERLGIARVDSLPELLETMKLFGSAWRHPVERVGVLTCSGGDSALAADFAAAAGLALAPLDAATAARLRAHLPDFASVSHPFDYNTALWGDQAALETCFGTFMDAGFDAALLVLDYPDGEAVDAWDAAARAAIGLRRRSGKPVFVASNFPETLPERVRDELAAADVVPLQGLDTALRALAALVRAQARRDRIVAEGGWSGVALPAHRPLAAGSARLLDEWESKTLLEGYGLKRPPGRLATCAEAPAAAAELGFPVVLKAVSGRLAHKTEAGVVKLRLEDAAQVAAAAAAIARAMRDADPAWDGRLLVERMATGAVAELILGVTRDPQFGPALVIGSGGILVNLIEDSATLLLPTTRAAVGRALDGLRGAKLLNGYRGRTAADREAIIDAAMALAAFALEHAEHLVEADVNPLLALPDGAVAVDALLRLSA